MFLHLSSERYLARNMKQDILGRLEGLVHNFTAQAMEMRFYAPMSARRRVARLAAPTG